jgi:hypothetical protein
VAGSFTDDANVMLANSVTYLDESADRKSERFEVTELTASNATVAQGDEVTVTATIENTGNLAGTQSVEYRVGGEVYESKTVSLESGGNTTVSFILETSNLRGDVFGHGVFTVEDSASLSLTVEAGTLVQYDADDDGKIGDQEVLKAISDWRQGDLSDSGILEIIQYWRTQEQI